MARVNVEERAFAEGRLPRLAKLSKIQDHAEAAAMGYLVFLWHDSQAIVKAGGSREDIIAWSRVFDESFSDTYFEAILKAGYITKTDQDFYEINGNRTQIENQLVNLKRASKGGRATKAKWDRFKKDNKISSVTEGLKPTASTAPSPVIQCSSMQFNAVQFNSEKEEELKSSAGVEKLPPSQAPIGPKKSAPVTQETWSAYSLAYKNRYGTPPVRNATVNAQIANFVKRVGSQEAPPIAEFFVRHNDSFYVKQMHPAGLMLKDAEKLRTEWATGTRMLGVKAREIERTQHNTEVWDEAAKLINETRIAHEAV